MRLLCPVRGCRRPLARDPRRLVCSRAHSFDVARSGYVNLLQAQDRRAAQPGDGAATIQARGRVIARGFETPITDRIVGLLALAPTDAVLDAGCGEGHHLAVITEQFGCEGHGLDISVAAIEAAADGTLLLVVPAPDDLIELRELILGKGLEQDRIEKAIATFAPLFVLDRHERIHHAVHLDAAAIRDVMAGSYRAGRASRHARLATVPDLDVTLSRDALLFRPARPRRRGKTEEES